MACIVHEVEVYTIRYHAESESRRSEMMTTAWCLAHQALMVQETRHSHKEPRTALSQARSKLRAQTPTVLETAPRVGSCWPYLYLGFLTVEPARARSLSPPF